MDLRKSSIPAVLRGPIRRGRESNWRSQVIYELHVGTFTREGTWQSAIRELPPLAELGITALEVMPVAEFAGSFGWGYDGVDLFAPTRIYGTRMISARLLMRRIVRNRCLAGRGLQPRRPRRQLPAKVFRKLFHRPITRQTGAKPSISMAQIRSPCANSMSRMRLIGSKNSIWMDCDWMPRKTYTTSERSILGDQLVAREQPPGKRGDYHRGGKRTAGHQADSFAERGRLRLRRTVERRFHHSAMVALRAVAKLFRRLPGLTAGTAFLPEIWIPYQGQWYSWQKQRRGTSTLGSNPAAMVTFLQNHDQIANSGRGWRIDRLCSYGQYKAMTAVCLLGPGTPMLSRPGIRGVFAVSFFCRSQCGTGGKGPNWTSGIPATVAQPCDGPIEIRRSLFPRNV